MTQHILNDLQKINRINYSRHPHINWACDKLCWMNKFKVAPKVIIDALVEKITLVLQGEWYGDEPLQEAIDEYICAVQEAIKENK